MSREDHLRNHLAREGMQAHPDNEVKDILTSFEEGGVEPWSPHLADVASARMNGRHLRIVTYCAEEVLRQQDGPLQVGYMVRAWNTALGWWIENKDITPERIEALGKLVEPHDNHMGFRTGGVTVGLHVPPGPNEVPDLVTRMCAQAVDMTPVELYERFEWIHPFFDGNGRTGKILMNWKNNSLHDPVMPRNKFGIANP